MEYLMLVITFLLAFLSRIYKNKNKKISIILYICSFITLLLFSGYREYLLPENKIGTDYNYYIEWFNSNIKLSYGNFGFNIIIIFIRIFTLNYIPMFLISSFLILVGIYIYAYKNTKYYELSILIFMASMMFVSFNIIRQWIACSVFLIAYKYLKEKDIKKYILLIFLASLFHSSALILILLYPIVNLNINMKLRLSIVAFIGAIAASMPGIISVFLKLVAKIDPGYYYRYVILKIGKSDSNFTTFAITMVVLLIIIYFYDRYKKENINANMELNLMLILLILAFLAPQGIIYNRLNVYLFPILMITVPNLLLMIDNNKQKKIAYGLILIVSLFMYV